MKKIAVVHLIRKCNGIDPLRVFIQSYKDKAAGMPHDVIFIFKGFSGGDLRPYDELLRTVSHGRMFVDDSGFDITSYFLAAQRFDYKYFIFLNSFSVILCEDWVKKMYNGIVLKDVGAVGATGSWESIYSSSESTGFSGGIFYCFVKRIKRFFLKRIFPPFPNYNLRTNAFMIARDLMNKIHMLPISSKVDAHKFESGVNSFTRQILKMGKRILVVGRDGKFYEKENWDSSGTFRQGNMDNLLVADNQTNLYLMSDMKTRSRLSCIAWGKDIA